jgi:protein SCO1
MSLPALVLWTVLTLPAAGAMGTPSPRTPEEGPAALMSKVNIEERLGEAVSLDLPFQDSTGESITLRKLFSPDKPVLLVLAYYRCPTLCTLVLGATAKAIRETGLRLGEDFQVVTVSIDPRESARLATERKKTHLATLNRSERDPDWRFLVGTEASVKRLADEVGFRYAYDASTGQYAHAAAIIVLTPEARVSRYLYGVSFPGRDLRLSLVEASQGRVGTSFDRVLLTCFRYDPATRRYGFYLSSFVRLGAFAIFGAVATLLGVLWRREWKPEQKP